MADCSDQAHQSRAPTCLQSHPAEITEPDAPCLVISNGILELTTVVGAIMALAIIGDLNSPSDEPVILGDHLKRVLLFCCSALRSLAALLSNSPSFLKASSGELTLGRRAACCFVKWKQH
jgi:hypothetical protein